MGRIRNLMKKTAAVALAAVMTVPCAAMAAMAAPADELNEILEKQNEAGSPSLLEETLGLSDLGAAIAENGLNLQLRLSLTEGTAEILELDELIPEDGYVELTFQLDPALAAWALSAGAGSGTSSVLDFSLLGDEEQLALMAPQFFTGALALSAGNLQEQYTGSALAEILGEDVAVPDIDLSFYPQEDDSEDADNPLTGIKEQIEAQAEALSSDMQVEKTEDGAEVIYTAVIATEDVMEFYSFLFDSCFTVFDEMGLLDEMDTSERSEMEENIESLIETLTAVLGDEISMDFVTENDLLTEIRYELYCDTTALAETEELQTEIVEEELASAGNAQDAAAAQEETEDKSPIVQRAQELAGELSETESEIGSADASTEITLESEAFQGYIAYTIAFHDPEDVSRGLSMNMEVEDTEGAELATFFIDWACVTDGTAEQYSCQISMTEDGEIIYSGTPFTAAFDSSTGDFEASIAWQDEDEGDVAVALEGSFSQIEEGQSFVCEIDGLTFEIDGEPIGISAELQLSADPGELPEPESVRDILKLTDTGISELLQEIQLNALIWSAQFVPETEMETETES